jgi:hypothetical protein
MTSPLQSSASKAKNQEATTVSQTEQLQTEQDCMAAARRSAAWLLAQQKADGGWKSLENPPVDAFYKAGAAFNLMGEPAAAERALDYVKKHFLQPNGDFLPRGNPWHLDVHYQYANGWLILGAQKQGRYDISVPGMRFLLTQQDPKHGGFYSVKSSAGESQRSDTMSSGIAGVACLAAGQLDAARRVAGCLERLIDMQPAPGKFYLTLEADGRLGNDFPADQTFWRVVDTTKKDQCWYAVGLPFSFALLLYQATGEERYSKLSKWFFDFQTRCVNPWDGGSSGKAAWGCAMRYRAGSDASDREIALRVGRQIMARQTAEGWFALGEKAAYGGKATANEALRFTPGDFDVTAEFTVWLGLVASHLLARDAK